MKINVVGKTPLHPKIHFHRFEDEKSTFFTFKVWHTRINYVTARDILIKDLGREQRHGKVKSFIKGFS